MSAPSESVVSAMSPSPARTQVMTRRVSWRVTDPRTSIVLILATSLGVMAPGGEFLVPAGVSLGLLLAVADRAWRQLTLLAIAFAVLGFLSYVLPVLQANGFFVILGVAAAFFLRFAAVYAVVLHLLRTAVPATVTAALRAARVPRVLTVPIAVVLRFAPVVVAEVVAVIDSMRLHGLTGWRTLVRHPMLSIGHFTVPVIASTLRVGDDLTSAALLRGLGSHQRPTSRVVPRLAWPDLLWIVVAATLTVGCLLLRGLR